MKRATKSKRPVTAESIARRAEHGEDVSEYFTNKGRIMPAIRKVDLDLTDPVLNELDEVAKELNISRQAVIKTFGSAGTRPTPFGPKGQLAASPW